MTDAYRVPQTVRPKAVCVFRRANDILVSETPDSVKRDVFYGPPGGAIEFGERSDEAARREMMQELGTDVDELKLIGILENIFQYEGQPGHEIVFVYDTRFSDPSYYDQPRVLGIESGRSFVLEWKSLTELEPMRARLIPDGLYELLARTEETTKARR